MQNNGGHFGSFNEKQNEIQNEHIWSSSCFPNATMTPCPLIKTAALNGRNEIQHNAQDIANFVWPKIHAKNPSNDLTLHCAVPCSLHNFIFQY